MTRSLAIEAFALLSNNTFYINWGGGEILFPVFQFQNTIIVCFFNKKYTL